jgi:hypothetical protein
VFSAISVARARRRRSSSGGWTLRTGGRPAPPGR